MIKRKIVNIKKKKNLDLVLYVCLYGEGLYHTQQHFGTTLWESRGASD